MLLCPDLVSRPTREICHSVRSTRRHAGWAATGLWDSGFGAARRGICTACGHARCDSFGHDIGPGRRFLSARFHPAGLPGRDGPAVGFHGRPVVLVFYPEDWSPVCTDQLALYQELMPEFDRHSAVLLAISVDSVWSHQAFANDRNLRFPLLADFEPKGEVARRYGVYREEAGTPERALFVLDRDRIVRWSHVSPVGVNPGADGILRALDELSDKEAPT